MVYHALREWSTREVQRCHPGAASLRERNLRDSGATLAVGGILFDAESVAAALAARGSERELSRPVSYFSTDRRSTTNTSVAFFGIVGGEPAAP